MLGNVLLVSLLLTLLLLLALGLPKVYPLIDKGRLSFSQGLEVLLNFTVMVLPISLVIGLALGATFFLAGLLRSKELFIIASLGISPRGLWIRVLALGLFMSLLSTSVMFHYLPDFKYRFAHTVKNIVSTQPLRFIRPYTLIKDFKKLLIFGEEKEGNTMRGVLIWTLDQAGNIESLTWARRARFIPSEKSVSDVVLEKGFIWRVPQSDTENLEPSDTFHFDETRLKLNSPTPQKLSTLSLSKRTFKELMSLKKQLEEKGAITELNNLRYFLQKQLVIGLSPFLIAFMVFPLALISGEKGMARALGGVGVLCFLYLLAYFIFSELRLGRHGLLRFLVWAPNLFYIVCAFIAARRLRY